MPNKKSYYGIFGGQYVPEILMTTLHELENSYNKVKRDSKFKAQLKDYLMNYAGRPTPLTFASNLSSTLGYPVFLKREDLLHTGAHKINNTLGQVLLAKWMKKKRIIAETGAGQHGVATATACALMQMPCIVYMGQKDMERQSLNVYRMRLMGAEVRGVSSGSKTLKDAINEAIRDWIKNVKSTHYVLGSAVGPHPYPEMVKRFQSVIGEETRSQAKNKKIALVSACVGGGSNAIGMFNAFLSTRTKLLGVEASGEGLNSQLHAASISKGKVGVLHGSRSIVLQTDDGQIKEAHSISAGLDYPGVGPEHAYLHSKKRVQYVSATDADALKGFQFLSEAEGIIPALESSHVIGYLLKAKPRIPRGSISVICLSGRGDKDVEQVSKVLKVDGKSK